jgi:hypothetical protein
MEFKIITPQTGECSIYSHEIIAQFLYTHLEEYGDKIEDILNSDESLKEYVMSGENRYENSCKAWNFWLEKNWY